MDGKLLFCVSVGQGDNLLYGPEWKEAERGKSLIDLFLQVCGSKVLGQQVQVLVSKDREFIEAAVVQVCTPLTHLSERSQSYIKFITKTDHLIAKNAFPLGFASDREVPSNPNYKQSQDLKTSSLCIGDPRTTEKWLLQSDKSTLHSLTSRPAFENMTVEEICDEIRRIRKNTVKSDSTQLDFIEDNDTYYENGNRSKGAYSLKHANTKQESSNSVPANQLGQEIEYSDLGPGRQYVGVKSADVIITNNNIIRKMEDKEALSPEMSRSSPLPSKTTTPKPTVQKKKMDAKRTASFRSNKSFKRLSESTRNKLNGKIRTENRNLLKDKSALTKSTKSASTRNISERLSVLAQPRKRYSEPQQINPPTVNSSVNMQPSRTIAVNKRSMEIRQSVSLQKKTRSVDGINKKSNLARNSISNGTFIKKAGEDNKSPYNVNKKYVKPKMKKKAESEDQYFVKIYTKDENCSENSDNENSDNETTRASTNLNKIDAIDDLSRVDVKHLNSNSKESISPDQHSVAASNSSNSIDSKNFSKDSLTNNILESGSMSVTAENHLDDDFIPERISPLKNTNNTSRYLCSSPIKQNPEQRNSDSSSSVDDLLAKLNSENNVVNKRHRPDSLNFDNSSSDDNLLAKLNSENNGDKRHFDDNMVQSSKRSPKNNEFLEAERLEKNIVNLSREIMNSSCNTSIESLIGSYLSPGSNKSPNKSPLFMHLLEKNHLKHHIQSSADTSLDDIRMMCCDSENSEHLDQLEDERYSDVKPGLVHFRRKQFDNNKSDESESGNISNDCCSSIIENIDHNDTYSKNNSMSDKCRNLSTTLKRSPQKDKVLGADKIWANSRGIKFTNDKSQLRTPTDPKKEENMPRGFKSSKTRSPADRTTEVESPILRRTSPKKDGSVIFTPPQSGTSSPVRVQSRTGTPDRNRKVWGNSIDGMDTMLIPSLQAFSLELRTLSENVTSNLFGLYDNIREKYDDMDDMTMDESKPLFSNVQPKITENGGDQQGVATVFRNLRKVEGQMKTIEQATCTMLKTLNKGDTNQLRDHE